MVYDIILLYHHYYDSMVISHFCWLNHHVPMVFLWFSFWFSCGFPMVFPCFSHRFPLFFCRFFGAKETKHCYALAEAVRTCAVKGLKVEECYMPVTGAKKKVISHWTVVFYWEIYGKIWVIYGKSMFYGAPSCNFHGNFMGLVENMGKYGNISI